MNSLSEGPKIIYNVLLNVKDSEAERIIPISIDSIKPVNFDLAL